MLFESSSPKPQSAFRILPLSDRHMRLLPAFSIRDGSPLVADRVLPCVSATGRASQGCRCPGPSQPQTFRAMTVRRTPRIVIIAVLQPSPPQLHGFAQQTHERRNGLLTFCVPRGVHARRRVFPCQSQCARRLSRLSCLEMLRCPFAQMLRCRGRSRPRERC